MSTKNTCFRFSSAESPFARHKTIHNKHPSLTFFTPFHHPGLSFPPVPSQGLFQFPSNPLPLAPPDASSKSLSPPKKIPSGNLSQGPGGPVERRVRFRSAVSVFVKLPANLSWSRRGRSSLISLESRKRAKKQDLMGERRQFAPIGESWHISCCIGFFPLLISALVLCFWFGIFGY
jgi:hypothetical protein